MNRYLLGLALLTFTGGCPASNDSPDAMMPTNCDFDNQCSEGRVCVVNVCRAPGSVMEGGRCTATRDCQSSLYCNELARCARPASTGVIGSACLGDGECTAGLRCNYIGFSGVCVETDDATKGDSCTAQTDCLAGLYCGRSNM